MNRIEAHVNKYLTRYRRITQISGLLLILIIPLLVLSGYRQIVGTYYSISFWQLDIMDPAIVIQHILLNRSLLFSILLMALIPLIIALLLGKIFCSWICPFNLLAEWSDALRKKVRPSSVKRINHNPKARYYWIVFASILILLSISGIPLITFISMPGLISAQTVDFILTGGIGIELALVPAVLLVEIFASERFWCRHFCPVGATLALFRFRNTLSVAYEAGHCHFQCSGSEKRSMCNEACPIQLNPKRKGIYPYCFNCGACVEMCQKGGGKALKFVFKSNKSVKKNKSINTNTEDKLWSKMSKAHRVEIS
jgi:ferredoxin-type protein NapH